jgi:hypothetical protein
MDDTAKGFDAEASGTTILPKLDYLSSILKDAELLVAYASESGIELEDWQARIARTDCRGRRRLDSARCAGPVFFGHGFVGKAASGYRRELAFDRKG